VAQYPVTLVAENNATHGFVAGRLTTELLQSVPDLATRTVMTCGPAPYMDWVEQEVTALGVTRFFKEKFFTPVASGHQRTEVHQTAAGEGVLCAGRHHAAGGAGKQQGAGDRRLPRGRLRLLQNQSGFRRVHRHQHHDADRCGNR
jgi:ferredoxin-NADP reductase